MVRISNKNHHIKKHMDLTTLDIFNNREISTGFWLLILVVWVLHKSDGSLIKSFRQLISSFFALKIQATFLLMLTYSLGIVFFLNEFELWQTHQIKNFIFWFVTYFFVTGLSLSKISTSQNYFSTAIKESLTIIIVFQFILSAHTFDLWFELILVPFLGLIGGMLGYAQSKKEYEIVVKVLNKTIELIGGAIILLTIYKLTFSSNEFFQEKTFYDFVVPTTLSILILPFTFCLAAYSNYEMALIRISFRIKDKKLLRYVKLKAVTHFHFKTLKLKRWLDTINTIEIKNKNDIRESITKFHQQLDIESNPPTVRQCDGWSPYSAVDFLENKSLKTGLYHESYDEWYALSNYLDLEESMLTLPNNLAYYVYGNQTQAKILKLKLNISNTDSEASSIAELCYISDELCTKAIDGNLPTTVKKAITNKKTKTFDIGIHKLDIKYEKWPNNGYDIIFSISI